ncbi:hypothetical protein AVT17_gp175 [Mycobacterium phage Ariel]|nr:hypothetical protein AVT17_gp175 [Mycobacterium phage Ariel]AIM50052.1 hypothetical protein PBI_ARIEL_175 [Mycobacterium phage Ariel]
MTCGERWRDPSEEDDCGCMKTQGHGGCHQCCCGSRH